jgi:hypothetical protein
MLYETQSERGDFKGYHSAARLHGEQGEMPAAIDMMSKGNLQRQDLGPWLTSGTFLLASSCFKIQPLQEIKSLKANLNEALSHCKTEGLWIPSRHTPHLQLPICQGNISSTLLHIDTLIVLDSNSRRVSNLPLVYRG